MALVMRVKLPSTTVSGSLAELASGSACVGSAAICGASLTLVIWMLTVACDELASQRSTACTWKLVLRTSEPSLTKRRPVEAASAVSSEAGSTWPSVTACQAPLPSRYCRVPPVGSESTTKRSRSLPPASLSYA
ncbi:Uncharacterised protein [Xylophilus ampelinus]|nr:Uncharacterised protein [Xylophilus ampelinus]